MVPWFIQFIKSQFLTSIPYPTADFSGQTVIVTGSNTGLGLEAARHLARLGAAKIILAVRNTSKGETAARDIIEDCDIPRETVEVWWLDMSDVECIQAFAERAKTLERLDAAVLNAGILATEFQLINGMESHIAVNVIGTIMLILLLLPKMRESAESTGLYGRVATVGSDLMYTADTSELNGEGSILERLKESKNNAMANRYALSKLLQCFSVEELAHRCPVSENSKVIFTDLTPGACKSDIFRDEKTFFERLVMAVLNPVLLRSTEVGSRCLIQGIDPELPKDVHGRFLMDCQVASGGMHTSRDMILARRWNEELFQYLDKIVPGCTNV